MTEAEMFRIRVPASTANLGPGFDSIGLALGLYLELEAAPSDTWEVVPLTKELEIFPKNETHFICRIALETAAQFGAGLKPCRLQISSGIPLTRGLGSSASAIVAGIELADALGGLGLSREDKVRLSSKYEGHPDNAGASVCGGLVVGRHTDLGTDLLSFKLDDLSIIAVIPEYELPTEDSRKVLPSSLAFSEAVQASAVSNTFLAAMLSKDYKLAGKMMGADLFHQPYRRELVPHLERVEAAAKKAGAFGTALSGAGPTVLCFVDESCCTEAEERLKEEFPSFSVMRIAIDNIGSTVEKLNSASLKL
ncbi:homoserine kinase [Peribacillus kribbensis]|uniref:homoserine kinase n=1 Tax=Peribacillus kribbensis TaxID=356658 RepID=UPI00040BBCC8|nr:homoserine kinase [Peribacillus kribbensis]